MLRCVDNRILRPQAALLCLMAAVGCGDEVLLSPRGNNNNASNNNDVPVARVSEHLLEDFDNQRLVDSVTGAAILDVNRGVLTLPVEPIPSVDGEGVGMFQSRAELNGLVEAESILVSESGSLEASDAVELRAHDVVRISGTVRAGTGGVTVIAGRGVYVDGVIESRGPVRILVEDPQGTLQIAGRVSVLASSDDAGSSPPDIALAGRSPVEIRGQVLSHAEAGRMGGSVQIRVYGEIRVQGYDARVLATAAHRGTPGRIQLRSEATVTLTEGAGLGVGEDVTDADEALGGDVEVQGTTVRVEGGARLVAGDGAVTGGAVFLVARDALAIDDYARVRSGGGPEGGSLIFKAARIGIGRGTVVQAGQGRSTGALFRIEASDRLDLVDGAVVQGGDTACGAGGDVQLAVGGLLRVRSETEVWGGSGSLDFGNPTCSRPAAGGNVFAQAREGEGLETALMPGRGVPPGEVNIALDPSFTVAPPSLTVGTFGRVLSKVFDRGPAAQGLIPQLVAWDARLPEGTSVQVELAGASEPAGPYEDWVWLDDKEALPRLAAGRFFRYRVTVTGRAYDAPELDFFELDLSPDE